MKVIKSAEKYKIPVDQAYNIIEEMKVFFSLYLVCKSKPNPTLLEEVENSS